MPLLDAFRRADTPTIELDDELWDRASAQCGAAGEAAYDFLSEVFYWQRNDYAIANFAIWPLCADPGESSDNPYRAFMDLSRGGWGPGWDEAGLFIYDRRREFGLIQGTT